MKQMNKSYSILGMLTLAVLIASCGTKPNASNAETDLVFAKGEKITNTNFTGDVWLKTLVEGDSVNQNSVGSVTFKAGARTKWHSHPAGQIILAISGEGYYQEEGSTKKILKKGDVVKCPSNIAHWHGASATEDFIQVAITGREKGPTEWIKDVSDEEYLKN
ncbi:cupin domain-containing protein [Pedobacter cryotolerans]|uniref:Cupin domain-containing protein n=2 Tax=Pedobacter cryotolerans TaxID=2571270 RepID=A0A4U1C819_9SPHI|nr:cupin domain-containing protein [Pedobacter cryotolerans]